VFHAEPLFWQDIGAKDSVDISLSIHSLETRTPFVTYPESSDAGNLG
jgi:hypothetical protein